MEEESETQEDAGGIKELREAADRGRKVTQENDALKREMAFMKAGIDTDSKAGQLLFKAYDGDLSMDAIRTEADELGLFKSFEASAPTAEQASVEDRRATTERQALAETSIPPGTQTESPYDAGHRQFQEMIADGRPKDDSAARFVHTVLEAASGANPDPRVISDQ
jgi:hypothetical protein